MKPGRSARSLWLRSERKREVHRSLALNPAPLRRGLSEGGEADGAFAADDTDVHGRHARIELGGPVDGVDTGR